MLLYFGANTLDVTDTTLNKIELKIGRAINSINSFKSYIIFCNDAKYYTGTDYSEYSCESLPSSYII